MNDLEKQIKFLCENRKEFNKIVYTPIEEAINELEKRRVDKKLEKKVIEYLNGDIPEIMKGGSKAVLFRQLITPNYEINRFMSVPDATELEVVFWEYYDDKFTPNNPLKHSLGKMGFRYGVGKKGGDKITYQKVIDFNASNGKKIKEIKTIWGQNFIDFHHELLERSFPGLKKCLFDASKWFHENGGSAGEYYKKYIGFFINHGILFENFILEGDELSFVKEKFLPAFYEVWKKIGKKPLIVALEPTDIEGDDFWSHHPAHVLDHVEKIKKDHLLY